MAMSPKIPTVLPKKPSSRTPLYQQIAEVLNRELAEGRYPEGERFPSQNELARRFDVTPNTAREAVAQLVQEGLLVKRFGSGTYVTGKKAVQYVGVVTELDISHAATSPFFLHLIQSVRRRLAEANLDSRLYAGHVPPFAGSHPDRISSTEFHADLKAGHLRAVVDIGCPAGLIDAAVAGRRIPVVNGSTAGSQPFVDYSEIVRLGVKALKDRGCRTVGCIDLDPKGQRNARIQQFEECALSEGMEAPRDWQVGTAYQHQRGDGAAAFRTIWQARPDHPDGLLVLDDMLYRDLAPMLLINHIRVPGDLVLASHINADDSRPLLPAPIQLSVNADDVGAALVTILLARMRGEALDAQGLLPVPVRVVVPDNAGDMLLHK